MHVQVKIVRFVEWHQPPIVEAELFDADGRRHTFVDKEAIFTSEWLDSDSTYPQPGAIHCEILNPEPDGQSPKLVRITTLRPDGIESVEGLSEFIVRNEQLSNFRLSKAKVATLRRPDLKTRLVENGFPDRSFDIEFWQEQGDEAIFSAAWELIEMAEEVRNGRKPTLQRTATTLKRI